MIMSKVRHNTTRKVKCHWGKRDKFLCFATRYIVFLLKNIDNESKAFSSPLKITYLFQNIFVL
jgi:hypothetical protein